MTLETNAIKYFTAAATQATDKEVKEFYQFLADWETAALRLAAEHLQHRPLRPDGGERLLAVLRDRSQDRSGRQKQARSQKPEISADRCDVTIAARPEVSGRMPRRALDVTSTDRPGRESQPLPRREPIHRRRLVTSCPAAAPTGGKFGWLIESGKCCVSRQKPGVLLVRDAGLARERAVQEVAGVELDARLGRQHVHHAARLRLADRRRQREHAAAVRSARSCGRSRRAPARAPARSARRLASDAVKSITVPRTLAISPVGMSVSSTGV